MLRREVNKLFMNEVEWTKWSRFDIFSVLLRLFRILYRDTHKKNKNKKYTRAFFNNSGSATLLVLC